MAAVANELGAANRKTPVDLWSAAGSAFESQSHASPIVPVARTGELPLSHSQERLYFLMQSGQNGAHYQVHLAWRVTGELKPDVLDRSLRAIVERHESLRTTFPVRDGRPVAIILPRQDVPLRLIDVGEAEAFRAAQDEVRRPFDLSEGPLIRAALFRIDPLHHLLVVTVCQIVFDGWSMRVFSRELRELYAAFAAGRQPSLPSLPIQILWTGRRASSRVRRQRPTVIIGAAGSKRHTLPFVYRSIILGPAKLHPEKRCPGLSPAAW